jgi:hypothetical protein
MKKTFILWIGGLFHALSALAQPANDACSGATTVASTSCTAGTIVAAADNWVGSVGCQSGGSHPDVWYRFVATNNQLNINVTSSGIGNPIEFILAESPCGSCACSFVIAGSACGSSPLVDSIVGLNTGSTYYYTISSPGTAGGFNACIANIPAVNVPGQDCPNASNICNRDPFGQTTVASGNGSISGLGSEEDVNTLSCFGSSERQSQWYTFTASNTGTIQFNINPIVSGDDYDFLLLDITTSGCNLLSGPATVVACNWSGCKGSTGITSAVGSEPGVVTSGAGCFGGPAAWITTPPTITVCHEYALLIDNFSLSNSGFNFTWGGATGGMTATIGPEPILGFTPNLVTSAPCVVNISGVTSRACYTYSWTWGDGTSSTGPTPANHTYPGIGPWTITQTITDANGCEATVSQNFSCALEASALQLAGTTSQSGVNLRWISELSSPVAGYTVQYSSDAENFSILHEEDKVSGLDKEFTWLHTTPAEGANYYRVVVTTTDGANTISNTARILYSKDAQDVQLYPNPVGSQLEVTYMAGTAPAVAEIMDVQGRVVYHQVQSEGAGQQTFTADVSALVRGVYLMRISNGSTVKSACFLKQ